MNKQCLFRTEDPQPFIPRPFFLKLFNNDSNSFSLRNWPMSALRAKLRHLLHHLSTPRRPNRFHRLPKVRRRGLPQRNTPLNLSARVAVDDLLEGHPLGIRGRDSNELYELRNRIAGRAHGNRVDADIVAQRFALEKGAENTLAGFRVGEVHVGSNCETFEDCFVDLVRAVGGKDHDGVVGVGGAAKVGKESVNESSVLLKWEPRTGTEQGIRVVDENYARGLAPRLEKDALQLLLHPKRRDGLNVGHGKRYESGVEEFGDFFNHGRLPGARKSIQEESRSGCSGKRAEGIFGGDATHEDGHQLPC